MPGGSGVLHWVMRLIMMVGMLVCLGGCSTWEIEPLPPEERGPRAQVPGGNTPPPPTTPPPPPSNPPGTDAPAGSVVVTVRKVDCAVCAEILAVRLRRVAGVTTVAVDQQTGRAVVRGSGVSREALRQQAEAGGFVVLGVQGM